MEPRLATPEMVKETLAKLQQPGITNARVLGVNIIAMQRAKNNGYPKDMYHATLDPVTVTNEQQETAMIQEFGFTPYYIRQEWPQHWYRRNMDPKFEAPNASNSVGDFIEQRLVRTPEDLKKLHQGAVPKGGSKWFYSLGELPALPDKDAEDPWAVIARLEGQLEEAQRNTAAGKPGRKAKEEVAA